MSPPPGVNVTPEPRWNRVNLHTQCSLASAASVTTTKTSFLGKNANVMEIRGVAGSSLQVNVIDSLLHAAYRSMPDHMRPENMQSLVLQSQVRRYYRCHNCNHT